MYLSQQQHRQCYKDNYIKAKIHNKQRYNKCGLCGYKDTINYIIRKFRNLPQKKYKTRHNLDWKGIPWELCEKLFVDSTAKRYMHKRESIN